MGTSSGTGFDHFALVRAGGTYYTFQNGILTNSFAYPFSPYYSASNTLNIGHWSAWAIMQRDTSMSSEYPMAS